MNPQVALLALGALVLATALLGMALRRREGRAKHVDMRDRVDPRLVGADAWGERATLLQFSTEFCARCPGVHRTLDAIADDIDGVIHLDVDLTHRVDLAKHFSVLQTPTTLILDRNGVIQTRFGGPVARAVVEQEIHRVTGDRHVSV